MPLVTSAVNGFWKRNVQSQAEALCFAVLSQARNPIFYERWGVADTLEGRFDCAVLHLSLLLRHLKGSLAQSVFDSFFSYTEMTLREEGVSDLRVGKQVKKCASFFYGALKAYNDALDQKTGLKEALIRNLYGNVSPVCLTEFIKYIETCDVLLNDQKFLETSELEWPKMREEDIDLCHP
ncbi:MAG: hypothetical protein K2P93_02260 [Alphaproteobacteria bacterium]|nr:hypothetical protein [Alphaproteobacteria bacterium]